MELFCLFALIIEAIIFVIITLISGAIAGTILGIINQALVEPIHR
jgi:hypothetical protein